MAKTVTIHGLKSCDATRAARKWLDEHGVKHAFHDVREDGLSNAQLEAWVKQLGWERVLNKASTTWRALPEKEKAGVVDEKRAVVLMLAHPALVKRPLLDQGGKLTQGFKPAVYERLFG